MNNHLQGLARMSLMAALGLLAALMLSTSAYASSSLNLAGPFAVFDYCPIANPLATKCLYTVVKSGSVTLGKKTVPIVNPVTFQGAFGHAEEEEIIGGTTYTEIAQYFEPTNGASLSKTPEPVPGGLLGLVPPAASPPTIRALTALYNEKNASSVTATVEPAGEIFISEYNLVDPEFFATPAQRMPIKIHLENPFLGNSCYIGSNSSPILWNLTAGTTTPPAPNRPISGLSGSLHLEEGTRVATLLGAELVENAWSAPAATGCGGVLAPIVDPLVDASTGLPSPAGRNTVILGELYISPTSAASVKEAVEEAGR
jgi:hypothetical protein